MNMVEKVALALIKADGAESPDMPDEVFDDYLLRARYAIEAMLEPNEEMRSRIANASEQAAEAYPGVPEWQHEAVYQAMIRAALEEK